MWSTTDRIFFLILDLFLGVGSTGSISGDIFGFWREVFFSLTYVPNKKNQTKNTKFRHFWHCAPQELISALSDPKFLKKSEFLSLCCCLRKKKCHEEKNRIATVLSDARIIA